MLTCYDEARGVSYEGLELVGWDNIGLGVRIAL
jgi:hypothetical protein